MDIKIVELSEFYKPEKIVKSGRATIVFWKDGTKTVVRLPFGEEPDNYDAFTAALAKKIFGSNSVVKKIVSETVVAPETKKKKKFRKKMEEAEATIACIAEQNKSE